MADAFACQAITTDFSARPAEFKGVFSSFGTSLASPYSATRHQAHYHRTLVALDNNSTSYTNQTWVVLTEVSEFQLSGRRLQLAIWKQTAFPHSKLRRCYRVAIHAQPIL